MTAGVNLQSLGIYDEPKSFTFTHLIQGSVIFVVLTDPNCSDTSLTLDLRLLQESLDVLVNVEVVLPEFFPNCILELAERNAGASANPSPIVESEQPYTISVFYNALLVYKVVVKLGENLDRWRDYHIELL